MSSTYSFFRPRNGREDLSDDLFELGPEPGAVVNARGAVVRVNEQAEKLLGLSRNDIIGRDFVDFVHDSDTEEVCRVHARSLRGCFVDEFEARMFSAIGGERWVLWRVRRANDAEVVLLGHDITEGREPPSIEATFSRVGNAIERVESRLGEAPPDSKWGKWLAFLLAIVGAIFAAGSSFALWSQRNATDAEVAATIGQALDQHRLDEAAHERLSKASMEHDVAIEALQAGQNRLELLARYLFLYSRWREDVEEARRRGRKPDEKPKELRKLEDRLMGFEPR